MKRVVKAMSFGAEIIPLGIASALSLLLLTGIPLFHNSEYYFLPDLKAEYILPAILYFVAVAFGGYLLASVRCYYLRLITVFVIAFVPRVLIILLFSQQITPFSDFLWSWNVASGAREGYSYIVHLPFPAYNVWAFYEYLLTKVFSKAYLSVLLTNAVIDSFIAVVVSKLTSMLYHDNRCSVIAGALYALFPSTIIYCTIGTPEFIAILFNLIAVVSLIKAYNCDNKKAYRCMLAAGIFFGISSSFKPFSAVIIVAYLIAELGHARNKLGVLRLFTEGLILLAVFFMTKQIILFCTSKWIGDDLSKYSSGMLYHQLLVGLNTEGEGQIHLGTLSRGFWNSFLENGYNTAAAGEYAKSLLVKDWSLHYSNIPALLGQKIVWAWQDDLIPIHYFLNNMGIDGSMHHRVYEIIKNVIPVISQVIYAMLCICGIATTVDDFRLGGTDKAWTFIRLILFGYFMLLLIIEAQSRYKCLIIPLICILAAKSIERCAGFSLTLVASRS